MDREREELEKTAVGEEGKKKKFPFHTGGDLAIRHVQSSASLLGGKADLLVFFFSFFFFLLFSEESRLDAKDRKTEMFSVGLAEIGSVVYDG